MDNPDAKYPLRDPTKIRKMCQNLEIEPLRLLSQHCLRPNALDEVKFGHHNNRGYFGACPAEILHLIHLGLLKRGGETFFDVVGRNSARCPLLDSLCRCVGDMLTRQSDRNLPRTRFPTAFSSYKNLMGHEMPGTLLILLFSLHTSNFRQIFRSDFKKTKDHRSLRDIRRVHDWILLIESFLHWERWVQQKEISGSSLKKSHFAIQWLMRLIKYVGCRQKGAKNKLIKFHLLLHLLRDAWDFGPFVCMDSSYCEKNYIHNIKIPGGMILLKSDSLTYDIAFRYAELTMLNQIFLVAEKSKVPKYVQSKNDTTTRAPKHCHSTIADDGGHTPNLHLGTISGAKFFLHADIASGGETSTVVQCTWKLVENNKYGVNPSWCNFVFWNCAKFVQNQTVQCFTEHKRSMSLDTEDKNKTSIIFRSHPNYMGKPWRDFCWVDWGSDHGQLPVRLLLFIDLSSMLDDSLWKCQTNVDDTDDICDIDGPGLYALVEMFDEVSSKDSAQIFQPESSMIKLYRRTVINETGKPKLAIISCDSITKPCAAIQDVGSSNVGDYLVLIHSRQEWPKLWDEHIDDLFSRKSTELDQDEID